MSIFLFLKVVEKILLFVRSICVFDVKSFIKSLSDLGMSVPLFCFRNVPSVFGTEQSRYLPGIKQMFQSSLLFPSESSVRTAAVRAYVSFMCENEEDDKVVKSLSDQVPAVIKVSWTLKYISNKVIMIAACNVF